MANRITTLEEIREAMINPSCSGLKLSEIVDIILAKNKKELIKKIKKYGKDVSK